MMNRHFILTIFVAFSMLLSLCTAVHASENVNLVIDGSTVNCDVPPVIQNGRTLVPARVILEYFGADVQWNEAFRQVVINHKGNIIILTVDSHVINLNGEAQMIDAAPVIINGRTMVPVRFIATTFGYKVGWDEATRTVYVNSSSYTEPGGDVPVQPVVPAPGVYVNSVNVSEASGIYTVNVGVSSRVEPKIMTLSNPYRIVFDFYGATLSGKDGNVKSYNGTVNETRWASHPDYTRVVIQCNSECGYSWSYTSDTNCAITLSYEPGAQIPAQPQQPVKPVEPVGGTPVVVIDAGHGGRDPGALGRDENGNVVLQEKDVCLSIALKVQNRLQAQGVSVIMTRSTDISLGDTQQDDLNKRAEIANTSPACLFVSIHNNAFSNDAANGTCVLYAGLGTPTDYGISGKELAQNLQDELIATLGLRNRGIVESPGIAVLRKTVMPAALVECAFITNPSDRQVLANRQDDIANAISGAIVKSLVKMGRLK